MLWIVLLGCSIVFLINYCNLIKINGIFNEETIKFSIYLIIGAYFFLILDKQKVLDAFGIKKGLSFITIEKAKIPKSLK